MSGFVAIFVMVIYYHSPAIVLLLGMFVASRTNIPASTISLIAAVLVGLIAFSAMPFLIIEGHWFSALEAVGVFIFEISTYFISKGREKQLVLAINEEIQQGNYRITDTDLAHLPFEDIAGERNMGRLIGILKSSGLVSQRVTYIQEERVQPEENYSPNDSVDLTQESYMLDDPDKIKDDPIANFERRHNLHTARTRKSAS
jgi:hypothetical protein